MNVIDFRQMYFAELQELRSVEDQLLCALPRLTGIASHPALRQALQARLEEIRTQRGRLDALLSGHGVASATHRDGSMQALLREAARWSRMVQDPDARDAGLIGSAQRIAHYEIAVYGTLATWAKQLGFHEDLRVLRETLEEEKRVDAGLSRLAKQVVNPEAAHA